MLLLLYIVYLLVPCKNEIVKVEYQGRSILAMESGHKTSLFVSRYVMGFVALTKYPRIAIDRITSLVKDGTDQQKESQQQQRNFRQR